MVHGFFAANGTEVSMKKKVVVQTYLSMINHVGETVEREIKLSALVGNTSNNILSTTQLVERGWNVNLGKKSQLIHEGMGLSADLMSWAGVSMVVPWIQERLRPSSCWGHLRCRAKIRQELGNLRFRYLS